MKYRILALLLVSIPGLSFAAETENLGDLITKIIDYIERLIPVVYGLGILVFAWGLIQALWKGKDKDDARSEGWKYAWFGVGIIFIAVSFSGLVFFITSSVGIDSNQIIQPPQIDINGRNSTTP